MISMKEIKSGKSGGSKGAGNYHESTFSTEAKLNSDNYYANQKSLATWEGNSAEVLGLKGQVVDKEKFIDLLDGKLMNPVTGVEQDLSKNSKGDNRRLGYDYVISPPKSVSIVGLVGGDNRVIEAHEKANARAMEWVEKHSSLIRFKDENGKYLKETSGNLIWASVRHETNRNNEPHLHNHNVIVAVSWDESSGKWRSLTNDNLYKLRVSADTVYISTLAKELKNLGYELNFDKNGNFEIKGITREQIEAVSTRRVEILEKLKGQGIEDATVQERQKATLETRKGKTDLAKPELVTEWVERSKESGIDFNKLTGYKDTRENEISRDFGVKAILSEGEKKEALRAVDAGIGHLSEREQTFSRSALEIATLEFNREKISIDAIEWAIDKNIEQSRLFVRANEFGDKVLVTEKALEAEVYVKSAIDSGKDKGKVVVSGLEEFNGYLTKYEEKKSIELDVVYKLSDEQVNAAKNLLMHKDSFQGIQGDAGTGKTAALEFVKFVTDDKGWLLKGMATSATATKNLENSSGIPSQTVASFMANRKNSIMALEGEIKELVVAINNSDKLINNKGLRVEKAVLEANTHDHSFGVNKYTFDHQKGEVYRSPSSLLSLIGNALEDKASDTRILASKILEGNPKSINKFLSSALNKTAELEEKISSKIISYEKVSVVEAVAARAALYSSKKDIDGKPDNELTNKLVVEYSQKMAALNNLKNTGNVEGKKMMIVMDETSMTGVVDMKKIMQIGQEIGARQILQGDIKQHGSVASGKVFSQVQEFGINVSKLEETRRFDNATEQTKAAVRDLKNEDFSGAIKRLDRIEVDKESFALVVADRYLANVEDLELSGKYSDNKVGVVALTNRDRKEVNLAIHDALSRDGRIGASELTKEHLDDLKQTEVQSNNILSMQRAGVDRIMFTKTYNDIGVKQYEVLSVASYDYDNNRIRAMNDKGEYVVVNPDKQDFYNVFKAEDRVYSTGERIEARNDIRNSVLIDENTGQEVGNQRKISNGTRGTILELNTNGAIIQWDDGITTKVTDGHLKFVDYAYAHTTFKEQGETNTREILAVSDTGAMIFNKESAYVALTRAKDNTEIVTSDFEHMVENSGRAVQKTTAIDMSGKNEWNIDIPEQTNTSKAEINRDIGKEPELTI